MRHLTIVEYGQFVGVTGERLVVREKDTVVLETPLSRLRSISITKDGIGLSSNLVLACAARGIRIFILDWRGQAIAALAGQHRHAIANLRKQQFDFIEQPRSRTAAAGMIYGKLRNQRAVLLYFGKYHKQHALVLQKAAASIDEQAQHIRTTNWEKRPQWREEIMGYEGASAATYWQTIAQLNWLGYGFNRRVGRGAPNLSRVMVKSGVRASGGFPV